MTLPSGILTENGKFNEAAKSYQMGYAPKIIKVYEKIKAGIWSYNGFSVWLMRGQSRQERAMCSNLGLK